MRVRACVCVLLCAFICCIYFHSVVLSAEEIAGELAAEAAAQVQARREQRQADDAAARDAGARADTFRWTSRFRPSHLALSEAPYRFEQQAGLFYQAAGFEDDDTGEPVSDELKLSCLQAYQAAMAAGSELAKCAVCGDYDVCTAPGSPGDRVFTVQLYNVAAGA